MAEKNRARRRLFERLEPRVVLAAVTDAGLADVVKLRKLQEINLAGTKVTDVTLGRR